MSGLLISDVDGTLLGDDAALDQLVGQLHTLELDLVYCSGRTPESIAADVDAGRLPEPRAIIGAVGTEIVIGPSRRLCHGWAAHQARLAYDAARIRRYFGCEPGLTLQPDSEQRRFKVSYFAPKLSASRLETLHARLTEAGEQVQLIYSSERDLDVLPAGVDKGAAARFLVEHLEADRDRVFTAGDSNNDRALLTAGFHGIVVGNAEPALRTLEGTPGVYLARRRFAAGVSEGLTAYGSGGPPAR